MSDLMSLIEYKFPPTASRKLSKRSRKYIQHRKDNSFFRKAFNGKEFSYLHLDEVCKWSEPTAMTIQNRGGLYKYFAPEHQIEFYDKFGQPINKK